MEEVLKDLTFRTPFGVQWSISGSTQPITVELLRGPQPTMTLVVNEVDPVTAILGFAQKAQEALTSLFGDRRARSWGNDPQPPSGSVPACPSHNHPLVASLGTDGPVWACPTTRWSCPFGGYEASFWPYPLDARSEDVRSGAFKRLRARGVTFVGRSNLKRGLDAWILHLSPFLTDTSSEAVETLHSAIADAVAPVQVEIDDVTALRTVRLD